MNNKLKLGSLILGGIGIGASLMYITKNNIPIANAMNKKLIEKSVKAVAILRPDGNGINDNVHGIVTFETSDGRNTTIRAEIYNLKDGLHGFHIHEYGDLRQGCKSAAGHFNPFKRDHGGPDDKINRHIGDLGNIESKNGVAKFEYTDKLVTLLGPYSVIGRSVVVHADPDDLGKGGHDDSKTTGHAGARLACGTIGLASPDSSVEPTK